MKRIVIIVAKTDAAPADAIHRCEEHARAANPGAILLHAESPIRLEGDEDLHGRRVLVVEDGPTTTHGGMAYGAGFVAASRAHARIVDPRPYAVGEIAAAYERYPHLGPVLPALGYSGNQLEDLRQTIDRAEADAVVSATPIDLAALLPLNKRVVRARYEFVEAAGNETLQTTLLHFLASRSR